MPINAVSPGRDSIEIDEVEVNLILAHRRAKAARKSEIIDQIQEGLSDVLGNRHTEWCNWPGTDPMATCVYNRLVARGFIKE